MTKTRSKAALAAAQAASDLLASLPSVQFPLPVRELASSLGITVKIVSLDAELSGMAFISNGERLIVVNSKHHANRQRFTIAHELGHHLLHDKDLQKGPHVDKGILRRDAISTAGKLRIEIEANSFAAELLMPKERIDHLIPAYFDIENEAQIAEIAKKFGVSTAAMTNRILNIK